MGRNRKQRLSGDVYRLDFIFDNKDRKLIDGPEHYIEGKLTDFLIVSVPESTSRDHMYKLREKLSFAANQKVLLVSHNVSFMKATKLAPYEAARVLKKAESDGQLQFKEDQCLGDRSGDSEPRNSSGELCSQDEVQSRACTSGEHGTDEGSKAAN